VRREHRRRESGDEHDDDREQDRSPVTGQPPADQPRRQRGRHDGHREGLQQGAERHGRDRRAARALGHDELTPAAHEQGRGQHEAQRRRRRDAGEDQRRLRPCRGRARVERRDDLGEPGGQPPGLRGEPLDLGDEPVRVGDGHAVGVDGRAGRDRDGTPTGEVQHVGDVLVRHVGGHLHRDRGAGP